MKKDNIIPYISGCSTAVIFGMSFLFSKQALSVASPVSLLSFRFLTAFIVMSILIKLNIIKVNYKGKNLKNLFYLGLMQPIVYFIFETYGIKYSSSSEAGIMIALIPIFVTLMAFIFLKERPLNTQLLFILLSVTGVVYIILMKGSNGGNSNLLGIILLFGAILSASAFNIISRKLSREFSPMELTYSMMTLGAVFFNFISVVTRIKNNTLGSYFYPMTNINFVISILYLGIVSSIIAFFLVNFTLSKLEASKSAVFANLSTVVSIIAGVVILKEKFYYYNLVGSIMILTGVWGTNYFGKKTENKLELQTENP
ncbi:DMT family transporter [Alkalithermobacter paradoxus]|uniref:O-acetylserine/cysteine export protein n=1 Tax=Alkalithermobacter paradoxus TaxID=29349 RepID=A0A1V4IA04_9FIRM|nr:O-acetylserine/cysteine export protein [[Clostridium] thermoalcaliphilum]